MLGLRFCARAFSSCGKRGHSSSRCVGLSLSRPLFFAEHRLQTRRLSSCGLRAQLLRGMWDPPRPGLEPASPALAADSQPLRHQGSPRHHSWQTYNNTSNCSNQILWLSQQPNASFISKHWTYPSTHLWRRSSNPSEMKLAKKDSRRLKREGSSSTFKFSQNLCPANTSTFLVHPSIHPSIPTY